MKKILTIMLVLALCLSLTACGKTADEPEDDAAENTVEPAGDPAEDTAENKNSDAETADDPAEDAAENTDEAVLPNVPENVLKATYQDGSLDEVILYQNDDESYGMVVSIYRLTQLEGSAALDGDGFLLTGLDASGQPITLRFYPETDSYTLEVTESTWEYLPAGETFPGFMPLLKG